MGHFVTCALWAAVQAFLEVFIECSHPVAQLNSYALATSCTDTVPNECHGMVFSFEKIFAVAPNKEQKQEMNEHPVHISCSSHRIDQRAQICQCQIEPAAPTTEAMAANNSITIVFATAGSGSSCSHQGSCEAQGPLCRGPGATQESTTSANHIA